MIDQLKQLPCLEWPPVIPMRPQTPIHGWMAAGIKEMMRTLCDTDTRLIVELGTWCGLSAWSLAHAAPNAHVVCVDHFRGSPEMFGHPRLVEIMGTLPDQTLANLWDLRERMWIMNATMADGLQSIEQARLGPLVDACYVDGNHSKEHVRHDVGAAARLFPKAKICGDDWDRKGVKDGVEAAREATGGTVKVFGRGWYLER